MSAVTQVGDLHEKRDQCLVKARRRKSCEAFDLDALTKFNLKRYEMYLRFWENPRIPKKKNIKKRRRVTE